ncbi:ArgS-related anticodon-binding protein NrtL [Streptomyces sp. NBC_01190]|uniref:ArgS-related anticodon-binding protein NrtL n=1 Tax=Streptomyces sp. NBC_01190 TaxID=2903767 RepID=UPI0038643B7A|nr:DALR anticodon-binding domain-containing protein [Streptomyces sp. NBC_01190]
MTPAELSRAVVSAVRRAVAADELRVEVPETVVVRRPPRPGCGDFATGVALQLAGPAGRSPYAVAEILARRLEKEPGIAQVEIAGAGFLNITLSARAYGDVVREVREQRAAYGYGDGLAADEPVTVAPAEPGAPRGELVAEVVNRLLRAAGVRPAAPGTPAETLIVQEPAGPYPGAGDAGPTVGAHSPGTDDLGAGPPGSSSPGHTNPGANTPGAHTLGPDATRWALLRPPLEDLPRLTAELLEQRESNPLFRVRYAHARALAVVRNGRELGVEIEAAAETAPETDEAGGPDRTARTAQTKQAAGTTSGGTGSAGAVPHHHPAETELLGLIADFPRVIESAARRRGPDRVARHMERVADAFFRFHDECPPLPKGDEQPSSVHAARTRLADATGVVLAGGLRLLGITAPDLM